MTFFQAKVARWLRSLGYRVFEPGWEPRKWDKGEAVLRLKADGYQIFPPSNDHPQPGLYAPDPKYALTSSRRVLDAEHGVVRYCLAEDPGGPSATISVASWHRWARRVRARAE